MNRDVKLDTNSAWLGDECVDTASVPVDRIQQQVSRGVAVHEDITCLDRKGPALFRWPAHASRFQNNAIGDYSCARVRRAVSEVVAEASPPLTIRLVSLPEPLSELAVLPLPSTVRERSRPVSISVSSWRKHAGCRDRIAGFVGWLRSGIARGAQESGPERPIILTDDGRVAETPSEGLFLVDDGTVCLLSPEGSVGVVPRSILEVARDAGYRTREVSSIVRDHLYEADEMFLVDASSWFRPVCEVDGIDVGGMGEVTAALESSLVRLAEERDEWLSRL